MLAVRALSSLSSRGQGANDDSPAPDGRCDRAAAPSGSRLSTSAAKRLALTAHARRLPAESLNQSASLAPSWRPVGPTAVPARWSRRSRSRGWLAASCYLGLALSGLGGLAVQSRHHAARDRPCPAPSSLPALLAMEVHTEWGWPTEARRRDSPRDPLDGSGPSVLGPPPQPGGTRPARSRGRQADHRQGHAPAVASAVAHVARFLTADARELVAIDFFGVPTLTFRLLFVFVAGGMTGANSSISSHGSSHRLLGHAAIHPGLPRGDRADVLPSGSRRDLQGSLQGAQPAQDGLERAGGDGGPRHGAPPSAWR